MAQEAQNFHDCRILRFASLGILLCADSTMTRQQCKANVAALRSLWAQTRYGVRADWEGVNKTATARPVRGARQPLTGKSNRGWFGEERHAHWFCILAKFLGIARVLCAHPLVPPGEIEPVIVARRMVQIMMRGGADPTGPTAVHPPCGENLMASMRHHVADNHVPKEQEHREPGKGDSQLAGDQQEQRDIGGLERGLR